MKKTLLIVFAAAAIAACSPKSGKTVLIGKFAPETIDSVTVTVEETGLDTVLQIKEGQVKIDLPVNKAIAGMIGSKTYSPVEFVLDGSTINIDFTSEPAALIPAPASLNSELNELRAWEKEMNVKYEKEMRAVRADSTLDQAAKQAAIEARHGTLMEEYIGKYKDCLNKNKDNYLGVYALTVLNGAVEQAEAQELLGKLEGAAKETKTVEELQALFDKKAATGDGQMFSDFTIEQEPGNSVKLSDYVGKGKYVLVDFWASWCGPCRREIPNIKAVYDKFHGDKFDVLSVAVWDKPEDTKKALAEEGLKWPQIINAQQIPTDIYGIDGIPHIILFGPDGTILKRGLRGEEIEAEVAKYVK